ncbi:hypothetical protein [Pectobacterium phage Nobby_B2]|uniref:Uncharacterized protein n=8 Tax=Phimunavirus TaxID=2560202 RepID=A0A3G8FJ55_9CAUD|nr:hypothetical protein [Pectobacterium phage Nobby_B1]AZF94780.1 hypothetical protein [Pectobacterium phage Nobby_B2]
MGKFVSKVMKKAVGLEKLTGTYKLTSGIYDKYLGTDIQGNKAAQAEAQDRERALNERALAAQQNQNIIGVQGTENIAQVEAGGSAADASTLSDTKKKRAGSISSTLGI